MTGSVNLVSKMKKHYKFPKIGQYRNALRELIDAAQYVGKDTEGNAVYDKNANLPVVHFNGAVKLHGTNAAIVFEADGGFYCQSRERIVSSESDNAGFASWVEGQGYRLREKLPTHGWDTFVVYGEWCGGSIQKGVALNELPKMFVVFGAKVDGVWVESSSFTFHDIGIRHTSEAGDWQIDVDLANPEDAIEQMTTWVENVENECPFGKLFDVTGIGEGLVFRIGSDFDVAFKVKGEKHAKSKIRMLPTVNVEKLKSLREVGEKFCDEERLQQSWDRMTDHSVSGMGSFIKDVITDIWSEENDTLGESGIERSELGKIVASIAVKWFHNKL
jgi:hypothetical protein